METSLTLESSNATGSCLRCQREQKIHLCLGLQYSGWRTEEYKETVMSQGAKGIFF